MDVDPNIVWFGIAMSFAALVAVAALGIACYIKDRRRHPCDVSDWCARPAGHPGICSRGNWPAN